MKEKKTRKRADRLEDLIPDEARRTEIISRLYKGDPLVGEQGIFSDLLQALVNAALEGEIDYTLNSEGATGESNRRNGYKEKQIISNAGSLQIKTPRDRNGNHEPILVKNWERELNSGMDEIILSLYARGQSIEDVRFQLKNLYGVEISQGAISAITDKVWPEITEWQQRGLNRLYVIVYLDAIHYQVREEGSYISKAVYTCYGVDINGQRDILGMYLSESEGSRHWGLILEDLKRRGVEDVFFFCIDGLTGFKEVIKTVFPCSIVQRCIVHMIRTSTRYVAEKDRKAVCADLRKIYTAANRDQALIALESFGQKWDKKYKEIKSKWLENWEELMAFMDYTAHIRRMIYTTNPVEALHRVMRKVTKSKGAWVNDKALLKQLYLILHYNEKSWKRTAFSWIAIQRDLIEKFGIRYEKYA
jgi:transposase-like protein